MTNPQHSETPWEINGRRTGPTTASFGRVFCGGEKWPFVSITAGRQTVAVLPAQEEEADYLTPDQEKMQANAAHIVLCVNGRDALVEALKHCADPGSTRSSREETAREALKKAGAM